MYFILYSILNYTSLYGVDQKYLEGFKMWCSRTIEKISWTYHVVNKVLHRVNDKKSTPHTIKGGRLTGFVTYCVDLPSKTSY